MRGSPTLNIAAARARKAIAAADEVATALSPRIDGSASGTRERFPNNGLSPPPLGGSTRTVNQLQATLSWEIDFWGKNRAAYEAALGAARAAEVDAYAARLALSTSIAQAYVQLQRAYLLHDVAVATLAERERIYTLTRDRNAAGLDSRLELKQAESAVPATREVIVALDERMALARNQIAALLGAGPDRGLAIERPTGTALASVALPVDAARRAHRPPARRGRATLAHRSGRHATSRRRRRSSIRTSTSLRSSACRASAPPNLLQRRAGMAGAGPAITLPIFEPADCAPTSPARTPTTTSPSSSTTRRSPTRCATSSTSSRRSAASTHSARSSSRRSRRAREAYDLALLRYREGLGNYLQVLVRRSSRCSTSKASTRNCARASSSCRSTSCARWAAGTSRR